MFINNVHGIIFVIDGTDYKRLLILKEYIEDLNKNLERKLPIVFLVNKTDVDDSMNKNQLKTFLSLDRLDSNFVWMIK